MSTLVPRQDVVDALTVQWQAIADLADSLDDEQWAAPSILEGWSVADIVAHIAGTEWMLTGREAPVGRDVAALEHVHNQVGELNEHWLDHYRGRSREELMADLAHVTAQRLDAIEGMSEQQWNAEGFTPAGPDTYGRFMRIRVFDCWTHEVDIRDSLGLPPPTDSLPARWARKEMSSSLPYVVGKRAAAPDGTAVRLQYTGIAPASVDVLVDGKASIVRELAKEPEVTLTVDLVDYVRLIGGRSSADPKSVQVAGDADLGERIVGCLHYLI